MSPSRIVTDAAGMEVDESVLDALSAEIDSRQSETVDLVGDLVRIPTEIPRGENYDAIVERLRGDFSELGFDAERVDIPDDLVDDRCRRYHPEMTGVRANLLARRSASSATGAALPEALWYTHLDVVPAGDRAAWDYDPYDPVVKDGYLYGRGAVDSKGNVGAIIAAFRAIRALEIPLTVSPVVALTTDEEIGTYTGLMYMADAGVFNACRWFHNTDAGATTVGIGSCGHFSWQVTVTGPGGTTAGAPVPNPIDGIRALLTAFATLRELVARRRSALPTFLSAKPATATVAPSLNVTQLQAGVADNVVPGVGLVRGGRRTIPEESWDSAVDELQSVVDGVARSMPELSFRTEVVPIYRNGWQGSESEPFTRLLAATAAVVRREPIDSGGSFGSGSDAAYVARNLGLATASHGIARVGESRPHAPNERARVSDILDLAKIIAALATGAVAPV